MVDGKMYEHGEITRATGEIQELTEDELLGLENTLTIQDFDNENYNYELLSEEDIEEYLIENE